MIPYKIITPPVCAPELAKALDWKTYYTPREKSGVMKHLTEIMGVPTPETSVLLAAVPEQANGLGHYKKLVICNESTPKLPDGSLRPRAIVCSAWMLVKATYLIEYRTVWNSAIKRVLVKFMDANIEYYEENGGQDWVMDPSAFAYTRYGNLTWNGSDDMFLPGDLLANEKLLAKKAPQPV